MNYKTLRLRALLGLIALSSIYCARKDYECVSIAIQNSTSSEALAVRVTDNAWVTIDAGNTYTYSNIESFDNVVLLVFTKAHSPDAFQRIKAGGLDDSEVLPPFDKIKSYTFDSRRIYKKVLGIGNEGCQDAPEINLKLQAYYQPGIPATRNTLAVPPVDSIAFTLTN